MISALHIDPEKGQGPTRSLAVRCGATTGTILLTGDGKFSFTPDSIQRKGLLSWFRNLFQPVRHQMIPSEQLLGARLESPCTFTVWFAPEYTARSGCVTKRLYRACRTPRYEVSDPHTATEIVMLIRRTASWWGRTSAPHVAAIINPKAGRGGATRLFRTRLLPLLRDVAGLRLSEQYTKAPGHATLLVRDVELNVRQSGAQGVRGDEGAAGAAGGAAVASSASVSSAVTADAVDLVMFVGGDGTLHEGLQGLFQRADWNIARDVPMVAIPCGSGNGVAASCGLWDVTTAAVAVCRGRIAPIDVATVLQPPNSRYYCLLSVVYGGMANLDIGTNHLRWMGELRFHLGGLREIIRGRCYNCRVFVLPPDVPSAVAAPSTAAAAAAAAGATVAVAADGCDPVGSSRAALEMYDTATSTSAGRWNAAGGVGGGGVDGNEGGMHEPLLLQQQQQELVTTNSGEAGGIVSGLGPNDSVNNNNINNSGGSGDLDIAEGTILSQYPSGPPLPLLSQLARLPTRLPNPPSALPRGWQLLADSFAIFGAYNTQYLALGARSNPGGLMGDGAWEVWQLEAQSRRAGAGIRLRCLKVLLGVEDGSFANTPGVMHVTKARAMLFQQRDAATWTVLDGEAVPDAPLYLEVHPRLCRLLVSPAFREEGPL